MISNLLSCNLITHLICSVRDGIQGKRRALSTTVYFRFITLLSSSERKHRLGGTLRDKRVYPIRASLAYRLRCFRMTGCCCRGSRLPDNAMTRCRWEFPLLSSSASINHHYLSFSLLPPQPLLSLLHACLPSYLHTPAFGLVCRKKAFWSAPLSLSLPSSLSFNVCCFLTFDAAHHGTGLAQLQHLSQAALVQ